MFNAVIESARRRVRRRGRDLTPELAATVEAAGKQLVPFLGQQLAAEIAQGTSVKAGLALEHYAVAWDALAGLDDDLFADLHAFRRDTFLFPAFV